MSKERPGLPEQNVRDYANELALQLVRERLAAFPDIAAQCRNAGAFWDTATGSAIFPYFEEPCRLSVPDGLVTRGKNGGVLPVRETILVLDYFTRAKGTPLTGEKITYKELHDGLNYFSVFTTRTIQPLVRFFGAEPETLIAAAELMAGRPDDYGDAAVTFTAFPRVPLTFVLWRGDAEFPPEGSILFDSTVADYLSNDDIHALCETVVWKLVRLLQADAAG